MNDNIYVVGTIEFLSPLSEAEIIAKKGKLSFGGSIGECKVEIYGNEGSIPHFHISNNTKTLDCCVCIFSSNFFAHGNHNGRLNNGQCKELDKWLRLDNKKGGTNWEAIRDYWIDHNTITDASTMSKNTHQPDYTKMNSFKSN